MIVEQETVSRQMLAESLQRDGYSVHAAGDGNKAWQMWQQENIRIVITDWLISGMDGLALCRKIRANEGQNKNLYTYIIIMTSKAEVDDIVEGLQAGADDYIIKPVKYQELLVRLKAGERLLRLQEELVEKNQELVKLNQKLEKLAMTDAMTGVGNRRFFYEAATKFHQQAVRYNKRYGLIICDIDYFKSFNDTYDYSLGDSVLQETAHTIKSSLRNTDEVFRYAGEEFVILLPEQDIDGATIVSEKIRKAVYSKSKEHKESLYGRITISCGVSAFEAGVETWEEVLSLADKALYEAKEAGRNCTKVKYP
jgi:two-component system chemotaxis response regulator CheY